MHQPYLTSVVLTVLVVADHVRVRSRDKRMTTGLTLWLGDWPGLKPVNGKLTTSRARVEHCI